MPGLWRAQDVFRASKESVEQIARLVDAEAAWLADVLQDLRFVVDRFVCDDFTVFAPPFLMRRQGDPVWVAVRDTPDETFASLYDDLRYLDEDELVKVLRLAPDVVRRHPVATDMHLWLDLCEVRGLDLQAIGPGGSDEQTAHLLGAVVDAWVGVWTEDGPVYRVSRVGLEREFENWLKRNLGVLADFELPLRLVEPPQPLFASGRRGDLLCVATADAAHVSEGDLVMIENKAHMVHVEAFEQLKDYVESVPAHIATRHPDLVRPGQRVHGLLLADGRTLELQELLLKPGYHYVSLAALGYREWLHTGERDVAAASEPDLVREERTVSGAGPLVAPREAGVSLRAAGPWTIAGGQHATRRAANRALAAHLGTYTKEKWRAAQQEHGLQ